MILILNFIFCVAKRVKWFVCIHIFVYNSKNVSYIIFRNAGVFIWILYSLRQTKYGNICDVLRYLEPFVQFKNVKGSHGGVLLIHGCFSRLWNCANGIACNFTKSNTLPWVFFTFSKFYRWYQIAQRITYLGCYQYISVINSKGEYTDRSKFSSNVYFSRGTHYVKSVRIRSYSAPHFPAFRLNTERYGVPFLIQYKWGKTRTRTTPNMYIFYAVTLLHTLLHAKNSRKLFHIANPLFEKLWPIIVRWI